MTVLLILLLAAVVLPLFVAAWRTSLLGLGLQGMFMFAISQRSAAGDSMHGWIPFIDLVLVRGLAIPLVLYAVLRAQNAPARNDVIAPSLFSWILAIAMLFAAYSLSERLVPAHGDEQALVAVAAAGILLGFLVLASDSGPFSQMVGVLRIENAIALLELGSGNHSSALVHLGLTAILVLTVALFAWYLAILGAGSELPLEEGADGSTL